VLAGRLHDDPRTIYLHLKTPRFDLRRADPLVSRAGCRNGVGVSLLPGKKKGEKQVMEGDTDMNAKIIGRPGTPASRVLLLRCAELRAAVAPVACCKQEVCLAPVV
jgi:hypothetical protein